MTEFRRFVRFLAVLIFLWSGVAHGAVDAPKLLFLDGRQLVAAREALDRGDAAAAPALARLRDECKEAMALRPPTVMSKMETPPSGDKHDYLSHPPYFWPNPGTSDGLPYVRRDGETYPSSQQGDVEALASMSEAVQTLAVGAFFTGDRAMADQAAVLLRKFFLNPETAMHPHLRFGQMIPGETHGRGFGIIDTRTLPRVCDSATLLAWSHALTDQDMAGLKAWFSSYLDWLIESPEGREEQEAKNNQGSWYDVQMAGYALFCGHDDVARQVLGRYRDRLAAQLAPDGSQPLELARTKSLGYSLSNLEALFSLMLLGDRLGLDLWRVSAPNGASPRSALEYLEPYLGGRKSWPHAQITAVGHSQGTAMLLRLAAMRYGKPGFDAVSREVFGRKAPKLRVWLLYPGS